jgi:V/A-type H+-transporting ATPase subunit G/H
LSLEITELQELIAQEKEAEGKVRKAREQAEEILKKAREEAESAAQAIESDQHQSKTREAKKEQIGRKKAEIEKEYKLKLAALNKVAEENFEKAVTFVTKEVVKVEV